MIILNTVYFLFCKDTNQNNLFTTYPYYFTELLVLNQYANGTCVFRMSLKFTEFTTCITETVLVQ